MSGPSRSHGIISFFDGSGDFADTLAVEIGPPTAFFIAELDPDIRAVISAVHGYHQDPKVCLISRGLNFSHPMPSGLFSIAQLPNKEQEAAAALANYLNHPRLPLLAEKEVDAELTSFGEDSMHDVTIPDRLMHDLIGSYFKSPVLSLLPRRQALPRPSKKLNRKSGGRALLSFSSLNTQVFGNRSQAPSQQSVLLR